MIPSHSPPLRVSKNLTELNCPLFLHKLSEILQQLCLLRSLIWSDGRTTSPHGRRNPRFIRHFHTTKTGDARPVALGTGVERRAGERHMHSDSHHSVLCDDNLPVWVMLTIIRQMGCQTIVRKAVKHFVLLSPA